MTPELKALARRAVACPRFRWLPGMAGIDALGVPFRCALTHHSGGMMVVAGMAFMPTHPDALARMFPDLTDPATLGCLLALVREAWRCPTAYVRQSTSRRASDGAFAWEVCDLWLDAEACRALGVDRQGSVASWGHGSEAEALIAALENGGGGA